MSTSILQRLAAVQASRPQSGGNRSRMRGIWHAWEEGPNRIRLGGDFVEVRTHFIAPNAKRKSRGLCIPEAFKGDDKLPQVINCPDWDIETARPKKEKTCKVCALNRIAREALASNPTDEEKKFFEALRSETRASQVLKWNALDRDNPFVLSVTGDKETKVLGWKIASIGPEAMADILGIFKQVGYDICDPDKGIDIEVVKDSKGASRTTYSARAVIEGTSLKVTPLTAEERALELHDLKKMCGRQVPAESIVNALHEDLRQILELASSDDGTVDEALDSAVEELSSATAPEASAPAAAPAAAPASVLGKLASKPTTKPAVALPDDDDDSIDGGSKKN